MKLFQTKVFFFSHVCQDSANCEICQTTKQNIKNSDIEFLLSAHQTGTESDLYNIAEYQFNPI